MWIRHPGDHSGGLQKKYKFSAWEGLIAILLQVKGMNKCPRESFPLWMSYHSHIRLKKCHIKSVHWFQPLVFSSRWPQEMSVGGYSCIQVYHLKVKDALQQPFSKPINILFFDSYLMLLGIISFQLFGRQPCFPIECYLSKSKSQNYDFAELNTWVKLGCWLFPNSVIFLLCETYYVIQFYSFSYCS